MLKRGELKSHPKIISYPVMILRIVLKGFISLMADQPEKPHICVADDEDGKCYSDKIFDKLINHHHQ